VKIFSLFPTSYWLEDNLILTSNIRGQEGILYVIHYNIWEKRAAATLPLRRLLCKSLRAGGETRLLRMLFGKSVCAMGETRLRSWRQQASFVLAREVWSVGECR
jgi:hypothetical protein